MTVYKPIKVLYMISSLANEGPTRILLNIVRNLDRRFFLPAIVTFTSEKKNTLLSEFCELDIDIYQLSSSPNRNRNGVLDRIKELRDLILHKNFMIAHAHCPRSLIFLVAIRRHLVATAYTLHIYPENQYKVIHGEIKGRIISAVSDLALRLVDKPIACSDSVAYEYLVNKGRVYAAVNNGIESMFSPNLLMREVALRDIGLDPNRRYLLFVGRLSPEKRIVELVRTFAAIDAPALDLVIVGTGPDDSIIRSIPSPHVHVMGFHANIRPFLSGCDFYVSPSCTEGLANTLLEAMSVGMPSLLSDIPSHRFVLERCDGFVGRLFEPLSPESLVHGMTELLEHDSELIRTGVRENFNALYHARVMTRGYEVLYKEMMK